MYRPRAPRANAPAAPSRLADALPDVPSVLVIGLWTCMAVNGYGNAA